MKRKPRAIELFAGVGGMTLGFEQAGVKVVGAVELDEKHVATHKKNFPRIPCFSGDLSKLSAKEIKKEIGYKGAVDIVFGGPPCQGFSIGGKMDPTDKRNRLVLDFARLVVELSPKFFVLENVQGFANARYRPLLNRFKTIVSAAGYELSEPKVLNAQDFGIPQRRARVFMVGSRKGLDTFTFPDPVDDSERPTVWEAISNISLAYEHCRSRGLETYPGTLKATNGYLKELAGGAGVTGFGHTEHSKATIKRFSKVKPGQADRVSRFIRLAKNGTSTTLRAGTGPDKGSFMAPRPIHPTRARCICVREAARLQSFPDWFVFHEIKWHAFRQIGNAVPPMLARAVATQVCSALAEG